jgi:Zn-dependent protease with chaperone function
VKTDSTPATWFDGLTAEAQQVRIVRAGADLVLQAAEGEVARHPLAALAWATPAGAPRPVLVLPDGGQVVLAGSGDAAALGIAAARASLVERGGRSRAAAAAFLAGLVAMIAAAFIWLVPAVESLVKQHLPWRVELRLGLEVLHALDRTTLRQTELADDVRRPIARRFDAMAKAAGLRGAGTLGANAVALPGRIVVVTDELVRLLADDALIDAVIAHELGHLHHRHTLGRIVAESAYAMIVAAVFNDHSIVSAIAERAPPLVVQAVHSRDDERESDAYAFDLLRRTGRTPEDFARAMEALQRAHGSAPEPGGWLSTHPPTRERIEAARAAK